MDSSQTFALGHTVKTACVRACMRVRVEELNKEEKNLPNVIPLWGYKREQSQCSAHTMAGLQPVAIRWMDGFCHADGSSYRSSRAASGLRWELTQTISH